MCKTELWTPAPPKPDPQHISLTSSMPHSHCDPGQVPPCDCLWAPAVIPGCRIQTSLPLPRPHSCLGPQWAIQVSKETSYSQGLLSWEWEGCGDTKGSPGQNPGQTEHFSMRLGWGWRFSGALKIGGRAVGLVFRDSWGTAGDPGLSVEGMLAPRAAPALPPLWDWVCALSIGRRGVVAPFQGGGQAPLSEGGVCETHPHRPHPQVFLLQKSVLSRVSSLLKILIVFQSSQ